MNVSGHNRHLPRIHRFRDAYEHEWPRPLAIEEYSHAAMAAMYQAGASRLPFATLRGFIGNDLPKYNSNICQVQCPFTGERLAAVPALNPDVTILHAQRADRHGNVWIKGIIGAQKEAALAAKRVIVTVEEQVDELDAPLNAVILPYWTLSAVCVVPHGAYPSYAHGHYSRDNAFCIAWDAIARDRETFRNWMEHNVMAVGDFAETLQLITAAQNKVAQT